MLASYATGLIAVLVINLGAGLYGLYLYKQASIRESEVREASSRAVATALSAAYSFLPSVVHHLAHAAVSVPKALPVIRSRARA